MAATIINGMALSRGRWKYQADEQLTLDLIWDKANHDSDYMLNYCSKCKTEEKLNIMYTNYFITARNVGVDDVPMWECGNCGKLYNSTEVLDAVDALVEQLNLYNTTITYSELAKVVISDD
jgi:hypothetical protein